MKRILTLVAMMGLWSACAPPTSVVLEPLRVINWSPGPGDFCVTPDTTIYVTFSDDLEFNTLTDQTFYLLDAGGHVAVSTDYDAPNFTAKLTPKAPLDFDTMYTVVATPGIQSTNSGGLPAKVQASFTTLARDGCTPGVQCQLPSDCPDPTQICSNIGTCISECVTDKDCYRGTCNAGTCVPASSMDGGPVGGDSMAGDPAAGDPAAGDPGAGDPGSGGDPLGGDP